MKELITPLEYANLYHFGFSEEWPGYKPNVVEIPNGDGKIDAGKRYFHINKKYLDEYTGARNLVPYIIDIFNRLMDEAVTAAVKIGIPAEFWPHPEYSTLRVLEYPPEAGSNGHTDFSLLTLNCYRNVQLYNTDVFAGEIAAEVVSTITARPHKVLPHPRTQYSAVFFAIPDWNAVLPSGVTVGDWIQERIVRSRKENY